MNNVTEFALDLSQISIFNNISLYNATEDPALVFNSTHYTTTSPDLDPDFTEYLTLLPHDRVSLLIFLSRTTASITNELPKTVVNENSIRKISKDTRSWGSKVRYSVKSGSRSGDVVV